MKHVIICGLYGTILRIGYEKLNISPLLKERILTGKCTGTPSYLKKTFERQLATITLFEDSIEFLEKASKTYELFCISNLSIDFVSSFTKFHLEKYLQPIFSCIVGCQKPQPLIYHKVLDLLNNNQKVYMIGDSYVNDYKTPRALGIEAYWLNRKGTKKKIDPDHHVPSLLAFYETIQK